MRPGALRPILTAAVDSHNDGTLSLRSPGVGLWRDAPAVGAYVGSGDSVGQLEVLGVLHDVVAPKGAAGFVTRLAGRDARVPVGYGDELVMLDPSELPSHATDAGPVHTESDAELVFCAPSSGRFYSRPDPDMPQFVNVGDTITLGQTVCLLEVMKTFNRINYGGEGLPASAKITAILPQNGDDLVEGAVILELEAV